MLILPLELLIDKSFLAFNDKELLCEFKLIPPVVAFNLIALPAARLILLLSPLAFTDTVLPASSDNLPFTARILASLFELIEITLFVPFANKSMFPRLLLKSTSLSPVILKLLLETRVIALFSPLAFKVIFPLVDSSVILALLDVSVMSPVVEVILITLPLVKLKALLLVRLTD